AARPADGPAWTWSRRGGRQSLNLLEGWPERQEQPQLASDLVAAERELADEIQSLPEVRDGLAIGRTLHRPGPGLVEIGNGLAWHFAPHRVMGEPFDLLVQPIGVEPFNRLHDPGMEDAPTIAEETAIPALVGQR